MAAQEGHSDVVKFLLANGASQSLSTVVSCLPLTHILTYLGSQRAFYVSKWKSVLCYPSSIIIKYV